MTLRRARSPLGTCLNLAAAAQLDQPGSGAEEAAVAALEEAWAGMG